MRTEPHDPALQWAAERAGLSYERFVEDLTRETIARIRAAYFRQNGTSILMPAVKAAHSASLTVEATPTEALSADDAAVQIDALPPVVEAAPSAVETAQADPETRIREALFAQMNKLPTEISGYKYRMFLATIHINLASKVERELLEKIVREEIRNVIEPTAIKLNHLLCG